MNAHRCHLASELHHTALHAAKVDRFVVAGLARSPQSYVQCYLMRDGGSAVCEASSGFYAQEEDEPRVFSVSPFGVTALRRLGFTGGKSGNFRQVVTLRREADLLAVADLMLATLFRVYGARADSRIDWNAPLAPGLRQQVCAVPGELRF